TALQLDLDEIASANLTKVATRWSVAAAGRRQYDADAPPEQQLPRRFRVEFVDDGGSLHIYDAQGNQIGDKLDDNAAVEDGYRFHDVFHLANAAVLGWSPVIRS